MNIFINYRQLSFGWLASSAVAALLVGCGILYEADAHVIKSEILVLNYNAPTHNDFKWLDNQHILAVNHVFSEPSPTLENIPIKKLVIWDIANNKLKTLPYLGVGGLCVGDGFIRFFTREKNYTTLNGQLEYHYEKDVVEDYFGPLNNIKRHKLGPVEPMSCKMMEEVPLPEWAQSIDSFNIIRLKPEHGFVWIDRDAKELFQKPKGFWLYPPHTNKDQGIDISKILIDSVPTSLVPGAVSLTLKYFDYQQAYLYTTPNLNTWWIYPNGKIETIQPIGKTNFKWKSGRKYLSEQVITRVGMVFGTRDYKNLYIDKDDGLFIRDAKLNIKRLVQGRIDSELELSPDGCKVAYAIDRREVLNTPSGSLIANLEVIDLCKDK